MVILMAALFTVTTGREYKGGEYRTIEEFTYGRFEARIKVPAAEGVLASFFTYHEISGLDEWNEIDIEVLGRYDKAVQFNTITPGRTNHVRSEQVKFAPAQDFHIYAFEWTPDYVAWFLDDQEVYRQTGDFIPTLNLPQKIMMNIWNPVYDNWVGEWNPKILPVFAYYDWVKYASYTPGSGETGTDNNFSQQWIDEFDAWDTDRWQKATHTFEGNNCDFLPENVVFRDGNMILCLTDNVNTGFVDKNPPLVLWARGYGDYIKVRFSEAIDPVSAEKASNYKITAVAIDSARLGADGCTVRLGTARLDWGEIYTLVIVGINDASENLNKLFGQVVPVFQDEVRIFPLKINLGGSQVAGYESGQNLLPQSSHGYMDGKDIESPALDDILGTDDDLLYRTTRDAMMTYIFRLANGQYNLVLKFCENKFDQTGARIFDVYVQGEKILPGLDIFDVAGGKSAYDVNLNHIVVDKHELEINFAALAGEATISAIELYQDPTSSQGSTVQTVQDIWLAQNYPNPFNSRTAFVFNVPVKANVSLIVYDSTGRRVVNVTEGAHDPGQYNYSIDFDSASGIYFYRLAIKTENEVYSQVKKMILLR